MTSLRPSLVGQNGLAVRDAGEVVDMVKNFINDGHAITRLRHQAWFGHPPEFAFGWKEGLTLVMPFQPEAILIDDHQQADTSRAVLTLACVHDHVACHLRQAQSHVIQPEFKIIM